MLDENSAALLAAINNACPDGGFVILEESELKRALKEGEDVSRGVAYLEEKKLIELRYAEDGTYCVRTMPAGRSYAERTAYERRERVRTRRETLFFAFLGSFAGGLLAALCGLFAGVLLRV